MSKTIDRRSFLRIAGASIGAGALYSVASLGTSTPQADEVMDDLRRRNGESPEPFTIVQLSDTHVGFEGPPAPLGTKAFERAVDLINGMRQAPDLVLVTGDLTQDSDSEAERARRMQRFKQIAGRLKAGELHCIPGEHDAGPDGGVLFRENFGPSFYSFDHKGVHLVGLDNVSRDKPEIGPEQIAWLKNDLSRFPATAPIIVFAHRPLFDLKPEWEWFTRDGDDVMSALSAFENVTVLYGHIHRAHEHLEGHARHLASRSLIFGFPDPATTEAKKPLPFDREQPFKNLGIRVVMEPAILGSGRARPIVDDVELTVAEYSGTVGFGQMLRRGGA